MKLLVLLNEGTLNDQDDRRCAVDALVANGTIAGAEFYSFLVRNRELGSWTRVLEEIASQVETTRPDAMLWSHISRLSVEAAYIERLRKFVPHLAIGHYTADPYGPWFNRMRRSLVEFCRSIDVSFWPGLGPMVMPLHRAGCRDIRYVPCGAGIRRYYRGPRYNNLDCDFDVVMMANRGSRRLPFRRFPGDAERDEIVRQFARHFGKRFAVFGKGWKMECAQGPVPIRQQAETYRRSRISVGSNKYNNIPYYFSNRLPIAMMSSVPHLTHEVPGLNQMVVDGQHCVFFRNAEDALQKAIFLLEQKPVELARIGNSGADLACARFSIEFQMKYMVKVLSDYADARLTGKSWPTAEFNPWLSDHEQAKRLS